MTATDLNILKAGPCIRFNNTRKYYIPGKVPDTKELQNFFPLNTVAVWNNLPAAVVTAPSVASFKAQLAKADRAD